MGIHFLVLVGRNSVYTTVVPWKGKATESNFVLYFLVVVLKKLKSLSQSVPRHTHTHTLTAPILARKLLQQFRTHAFERNPSFFGAWPFSLSLSIPPLIPPG